MKVSPEKGGGGEAGEYGIETASPYRRPAPWSNFGEKEKRLCAVLLEFLLAPSSLNFSLPTSFCHPPQNSLSLSLTLEFSGCVKRGVKVGKVVCDNAANLQAFLCT